MSPLPYDESAARQDPAVRFRAALIQALEDVRPVLTARFSRWQAIPRLQTSLSAFGERMDAVTSGKRARVDFKRIFARFLKDRLPDFPSGPSAGEIFRCVKPFDAKLSLLLEWNHRHAYGVGKMLELKIGARWDSTRGGFYYPLPRFFGWGDLASWAYVTKQDLEECLNGAADFLAILIPALSEAIRKRMDDPAIAEGPGAITARGAYALARPVLDVELPGAELANVFLWYGFEERWGAPVASDGRLRAHGAWSFQFAGPKGGGATAEVPAVGRASILTVSQIIRTQERVVEPWIDSNAALEAVAASGSIPKDAAPTGMGIQHGKPYTDEAVWRIDYAGHARLSRAGAMVEISTGRVVTTWS